MYYKIINTECEVYKKLHQMRTQELQWEKENREAIEAKIGLEWSRYFGREGQQNFSRVTQYSGFDFVEKEKVDPKIWANSKVHPGLFEPNRRTKVGREMANFLANGLKGHWFRIVFDILNLERPMGRFTFPYVEICDQTIVMFLGDNIEPKDENIIEITKKEANSLLKID